MDPSSKPRAYSTENLFGRSALPFPLAINEETDQAHLSLQQQIQALEEQKHTLLLLIAELLSKNERLRESMRGISQTNA